MLLTLLKSKIHRATVTHCELHYEGSCGIDADLLAASKLMPNEQIHVWNVNNGERFITYAIEAPAGSGIISLNGSAARRASVGDLVIIAAFGVVDESELPGFAPRLVFSGRAEQDQGGAERRRWASGWRSPWAVHDRLRRPQLGTGGQLNLQRLLRLGGGCRHGEMRVGECRAAK